MTYPRAITAQLIDTDGTTVVTGSPLANAFGITTKDETNGVGVGAISVPLSEAGAAEVTPGRFVDVLVGGTSRFTFQIEGDPTYREIQRDGQKEQVVTVQGRGWGSVLDQGIVYPSNLSLDLDTAWRLFSFASPDFPNAGAWAAADELYEWLDAATYPTAAAPYRAPYDKDGLRYPAPFDFPLPSSPNFYDPASPPGANYVDVFWIWPTGEETSIGFAFFRRTLTITADGVYTLAITADNFFTLFLEGVPILGEQTNHNIWKYWKEVELGLPIGTYQIGVVVENTTIGALGTNPAGLLMTVHTLDNGQLPDSATLVTDSNWVCEFATDFWPGWTPGQIIDTVIDEAVARGALTAFDSITFTATTDTATNAWADSQESSPYIPAFAAEIGSTIMSMLGKMVDEGHIDWHVQSGTLKLDAWAAGSAGSTPGVSLVAGTNLVTLERGSTNLYANALLVQWERGYVEVSDAAEITAFGSAVEDIYSSDGSTPDEGTRRGQVELTRRVEAEWPAIVVTVEPTSSADCPYEGFGLFDTITIPAVGGGTQNVRVVSISIEQDDEGYAIWRLELNRPWRAIVRETGDLLREIGGKSGNPYGVVQ